jgi:hypothetical protein
MEKRNICKAFKKSGSSVTLSQKQLLILEYCYPLSIDYISVRIKSYDFQVVHQYQNMRQAFGQLTQNTITYALEI